MILLILAGLREGVLGSAFRLRMTRIGHKGALLEGGAFDYRRYRKVRKEYGVAVWPV
jgi:hypothetical protein